MTPQQQKWLLESGDAASNYFNGLAAEAVEKFMRELKSQGVTVYEIDRNEFSVASRNFANIPEYKNVWSPGLYDRVTKILGK